eukprot:scaffold9882_cov64-Cylindrotheca_fusiformis.AAC.1
MEKAAWQQRRERERDGNDERGMCFGRDDEIHINDEEGFSRASLCPLRRPCSFQTGDTRHAHVDTHKSNGSTFLSCRKYLSYTIQHHP